MTNIKFDPGMVLGDKITELSRRELCELVSKICALVRAEAGPGGFRGGIYPENISQSADGSVSLGLARQKDWDGQELQFVAPELYWNNGRGPASDVYSLGMLLYYGVNEGRLPYEGECDNPQLRRMGGDNFPAPKGAGRRLGEIIEKAIRFKAAERYRNVEEMQIMLDSCVKNLYLKGVPSSEAIFKKSDDDLSEIERIMVGIIERDEEQQLMEDIQEELPEEVPEETPEEAPEATIEEAMEEAPEGEEIQTEEPEDDPIARAFAAGEEPVEEEPVEEEPAEEEPAEDIPAEDIRLYEPKKEKKEEKPAPAKAPIPILTVEKNPELEPVIPRKPPITPAVQYGKAAQREKKIAQEVKKRRRKPLVLILVLCALLVVTAIIINALLRDFVWNEADDGGTPTPTAQVPQLEGGGAGIVVIPSPPAETETPAPQQEPVESTYQVFREDLSWTAAQARCAELGGHLVVISDLAELEKVVQLVEQAGISRAWIGCHRVDGTLVWENGDEVTYYPWDAGEPSYEDSYDGAAEDYIMLWNHNGWVYNDSRNDPVAEYPQWYSGTIGFICEFEG